MMPKPLLLSRLPPKNMPNCASIEIAPAMVAVIVMISVSRFLMCASSCAITPAASSRESICNRPVFTATAAFSRIAAGRERIRLRIVDDVDARHRQAGAARELLHQRVEVGRGARVDLLGAVHRQHHPVRVPVGEQVHARRDDERDHRAARAADQVADAHEQRGQSGKQDGRAHDSSLSSSKAARNVGAASIPSRAEKWECAAPASSGCDVMQHPDNALTAIRFAPFRRSQRSAARSAGCGHTLPVFRPSEGRGMERREAPGRCATAPLHAPCDRGVYAPCGAGLRDPSRGARVLRWRVCEARRPDAAPPGAPPRPSLLEARPAPAVRIASTAIRKPARMRRVCRV